MFENHLQNCFRDIIVHHFVAQIYSSPSYSAAQFSSNGKIHKSNSIYGTRSNTRRSINNYFFRKCYYIFHNDISLHGLEFTSTCIILRNMSIRIISKQIVLLMQTLKICSSAATLNVTTEYARHAMDKTLVHLFSQRCQ
jgi:hypothetical protein